jgi:Arc/MetJ family transcription regulator
MRTNIDIDDKLMAEAIRVSGAASKRAAVQMALQLLIRTRGQAALRNLRGKIGWEGDTDTTRRGPWVK